MKDYILIGIAVVILYLLFKSKKETGSYNFLSGNALQSNGLPVVTSTPPSNQSSYSVGTQPGMSDNSGGVVVIDSNNPNNDYLSGPDDFNQSGTFAV